MVRGIFRDGSNDSESESEKLKMRQIESAPSKKALAYYKTANALRIDGKSSRALMFYTKALRESPDFAECLCSSGIVREEAGHLEEALSLYERAQSLRPNLFAAVYNRGNALVKLGQFEEAYLAFENAIALRPGDASALCNRGIALFELGRLDEAIKSYEMAIRANSRLPQAAFNLGNALLRSGQTRDALFQYEYALKISPEYPAAHCGRGIALKELGLFSAALKAFHAALQLDPNLEDAKSNKGGLLLLRGDFAEGWDAFESRWAFGVQSANTITIPVPEWSGETRPGCRILVINDHGLGDAIQFCRYLPVLTQMGLSVTFLCHQKIHKLIGSVGQDIALIDRVDPDQVFDYQIFLCSLPRVLKIRLETISARIPYLHVDQQLSAKWVLRLSGPGLKIGICWQGNTHFKVDRTRSIPLDEFSPIAALNGVRLFSLQVGEGTEQIDEIPFRHRLETFDGDVDAGGDAFTDTAAIMNSLDLILTCDTSIAHLAGALGRPVWLLLRHIPEWRWLLKRSDSPWYPSMRIFRQTQSGNWGEVMTRVHRAIREQLGNPRNDESCMIPTSIGELYDKISILRIKSERISDASKLKNVRAELEVLEAACPKNAMENETLASLCQRLRAVNSELWEIEDAIRLCEKSSDFGPRFVELARSIYKKNDLRAELKREINALCDSTLREEKSYG